MTLGQKLKILLREKNMTQEEFAEQLDVSRQAVGKWVNDKGIPEVNKLIQISNMFGVSLDYLLKEDSAGNDIAEGGYYVSGEMLEGYLAYHRQNRKRIIGGLGLFMVANIFAEIGSPGNSVMEGLYWIVTLAGLALLIWHCFQSKKYQEIKREKLIFDSKIYEAFKMRREKERKRCACMAIAGIVLLIGGTELIDYLEYTMRLRIFGVSAGALGWISDATALSFILWAAMSVMAENTIVKNTEGVPKNAAKRFAWIYWAVPVTALAVLIGFVSNIWSPMAPIIVLFCALLVTVCKLLLERGESK
ncbi:MAG: helix-turn-helix transcriptional regulator [Lachnospiraceae bacterium]|nr:helix-turn-helix transcriptional regulator [Lachnospiraceae bacterium]